MIRLQVHTNDTKLGCEKIGNCTYWNPKTRTLVQPWGTPLLRDEFRNPSSIRLNNLSFWVGSVWNNEYDQGNLNEFGRLQSALSRHGVKVVVARVPERLNQTLVRCSVAAPAIAGRWQAEKNYLPCRLFKNISFGQLGSTNVEGFSEILGSALVYDSDIDQVVDKDLSITGKQRAELIKEQQKAIAAHTYEAKLAKFIQALSF